MAKSSEEDYEEKTEEKNEKKSKKGKSTKLLIITIIFLVLLGVYVSSKYLIVALVDNKPVTRYQLIQELEKNYAKDTVENLIVKELLVLEANTRGITISNEDIDKEIENVKNILSQQGMTLEAALEAEGLDEASLRENINFQKVTEALLKDKISVSDEDIQKYFDENKQYYGEDANYDDVKDSIRQLLESQKYQENFQGLIEELKQKYSIHYLIEY